MQVETEFETEFLSLAEHAARLGVAKTWVANRVAAGTWPARVVKLGRRRLVHVGEHQRMVRDLLESAGIKTPPASPDPSPQVPAPAQPAKRKPGRPREAAGEPQ